jgi:cyanophycinase
MTPAFQPAHTITAFTTLTAIGVFYAAPGWAGSLVLVGGNLQYPATGNADGISIYQEIVDLAGGSQNAKIGIFTTASSAASAASNAQLWIEDFQDPAIGVEDVEWIPIDVSNCATEKNNPALAAQIATRTGFMFGGGDQSRITQCLFDETAIGRTSSLVFDALKTQFDAGAVVAGTSAGTAVQTGAPMITEGESYEAFLQEPISLVGAPPLVRDLYYNPLGGLGFFNYGLTDSHYSERGRQGRTTRLAAALNVPTVYGVDENTALIVTDPDTPNVSMSVIGQGGVFITDLTQATVTEIDYWAIDGVRATYLTAGDRFNPLTGEVTFADWKTSLSRRETLDFVSPESDIFSSLTPEPPPEQERANPRALTDLAIDLINSRAASATGTSYETDPVTYRATLTKDAATAGFAGANESGVTQYSFENLLLSIAADAPAQTVPESDLVLGLLTVGAIGVGARRRRNAGR